MPRFETLPPSRISNERPLPLFAVAAASSCFTPDEKSSLDEDGCRSGAAGVAGVDGAACDVLWVLPAPDLLPLILLAPRCCPW